jgi:hypothetical protein
MPTKDTLPLHVCSSLALGAAVVLSTAATAWTAATAADTQAQHVQNMSSQLPTHHLQICIMDTQAS